MSEKRLHTDHGCCVSCDIVDEDCMKCGELERCPGGLFFLFERAQADNESLQRLAVQMLTYLEGTEPKSDALQEAIIEARKALAQTHPGDPLREQLERLLIDSLSAADDARRLRDILTQTRDALLTANDFSITLATQDLALQVAGEYNKSRAEAKRYKSFIEEQKRKCEVHFSCESCVIGRVAGCPIFEALNPQKEGA